MIISIIIIRQALQLIGGMREAGILPDVVTHSAVLAASGSCRQWEACCDIVYCTVLCYTIPYSTLLYYTILL